MTVLMDFAWWLLWILYKTSFYAVLFKADNNLYSISYSCSTFVLSCLIFLREYEFLYFASLMNYCSSIYFSDFHHLSLLLEVQLYALPMQHWDILSLLMYLHSPFNVLLLYTFWLLTTGFLFQRGNLLLAFLVNEHLLILFQAYLFFFKTKFLL